MAPDYPKPPFPAGNNRCTTMPDDSVKKFGKQVPMKRRGQPAELATAYLMLANPLSSYVSGTTIAVTGGKPSI